MTAQGRFELDLLAFHAEALFLGEAFCTVRHHFVDLLEARDRLGNGFPVGQRATEPAVVHVILCAFFSSFSDLLSRLALGADEENAAAFCNGVADSLQSSVQHRHGLRQIEDVDPVALAVDELAHAGVPALRLVTVVNASFEELTHREFGKRHYIGPFPV